MAHYGVIGPRKPKYVLETLVVEPLLYGSQPQRKKSHPKRGGWIASFYKPHPAHRICAHHPREKMVNPFYKHVHIPKPIVFAHTLPGKRW